MQPNAIIFFYPALGAGAAFAFAGVVAWLSFQRCHLNLTRSPLRGRRKILSITLEVQTKNRKIDIVLRLWRSGRQREAKLLSYEHQRCADCPTDWLLTLLISFPLLKNMANFSLETLSTRR